MAVEHEARIVRTVEHAADTRSLMLRQTDGPRIAFRPGQFISCLLPVGRATLIRPYSMASDPENDDLEICLDRVPGGPGSAYLLGLSDGAAIRFTGPWGTFVLERAPDAETVFIAHGTGIAAIRPMIRRAVATNRGRPLALLHGVPDAAAAPYRDELEALARRTPSFRVEHVSSARLPDEVARRWVNADQDRSRHFFVCGIGAIVPALRDLLRGAGYERRAVQYEKW
jgi:ferredoxin-NADP reductase